MLKTYKYRIYPTKEQTDLFAKHFGCVRFIYNWGLSKKIEEYQKNKRSLSYFDLSKELTLLKKQQEYKWLREVSVSALQQSLRHLDNAFTNFFRKKKGFPNFKTKKSNLNSYSLPEKVKIDFKNKKIILPKFKNGVKTKIDRIFEGKIKTCVVKKTSTNKYFITMLVQDEKLFPDKPIIEEKNSIGIDLGLKTFATLSTGEKIENQKYLMKFTPRLKILQKRLNKKQKNSKNYIKAKLKLALLHEKINNCRNDFLHKLTHRLTHDNQMNTLCLETLNVKGMIKNHNLARSINDVAWSKFNEYLEYKTEWYGKNLIRIGRFEPSSKICSVCGNINNDLKLQDRKWVCPVCKSDLDRDINAAKNILKFALQQQNLVYSGQGMPVESVESSTLVETKKQKVQHTVNTSCNL